MLEDVGVSKREVRRVFKGKEDRAGYRKGAKRSSSWIGGVKDLGAAELLT